MTAAGTWPHSRYSREEKLLAGLDVAGTRGIEIGALASPLLRPPDADIRFVDHADQAALREKYRGDANVDPDAIVPVDAVWGERTLAECFPGELFDYLVASHVIEHVPDMIGWLGEIAGVLRPGGRLILAVPDRRYSFDVLRRETSLSELVGNHLAGARRPTPAQVFDYNAHAVELDHITAWTAMPAPAALRRYITLPDALAMAKESRDGVYRDSHCSVFTARSLLGLLDGLLELGLLPFRLERFHVAPFCSCEMSRVLSRWTDAADVADARQSIKRFLESGTDSEGFPLDAPSPTLDAPAANDDHAAALQLALTDIRVSTSWRLTHPLRWSANRLRALRAARKR